MMNELVKQTTSPISGAGLFVLESNYNVFGIKYIELLGNVLDVALIRTLTSTKITFVKI